MPHTLTLTYQPRLSLHAEREDERGGGLLAVADAAVQQLLTLWRGLFTDVRQAVRLRTLAQALDIHPLEGRNYLAQLWERFVEDPAWSLLVGLGASVMQAGFAVQERAIRRLTRDTTPLLPDSAASQQALDAYVGTQIRDIMQTSLATVQRVIRAGTQAGQSPTALARDLQQVLGLTPQQERALQGMRTRLEAQGKPAPEITRLLDQATRQGIQRRALTIARTESVRLAHMGSHQAWQSAVASGRVDVERLRRYWRVRAGACVEHCGPIPGMNPEGVGLNEAFQTPDGPVLLPPLHPSCRCSVTMRVRGAF